MKFFTWLDEKTKFLDEIAINFISSIGFMLGTQEGRRLTFYRPSVMVLGFFATLFVSGRIFEITNSIWFSLVSALIITWVIAWATNEIEFPSTKKE